MQPTLFQARGKRKRELFVVPQTLGLIPLSNILFLKSHFEPNANDS